MTNNNEIRYVYQVPRTFQVAELKGQQRKESSLSVAARAKVINRSGSNYVGENRSYGPCEYSDCSHSEKTRFYLVIGFSQKRMFNWHFSEGDKNFDWLTIYNIGGAYKALKDFEDGTYKVVGATGDSSTDNAKDKKASVMSAIQRYIKYHEGGGDVYEPRDDYN